MPPPGCPQANGRQPETPRQVWQRPCTASQVAHSGVACPCSHCSAGQTATAEHLPVAVPPSHQDPVLLPQSQQGRISPASSPITLSSPLHPTPPTPLTRARPVRTGCRLLQYLPWITCICMEIPVSVPILRPTSYPRRYPVPVDGMVHVRVRTWDSVALPVRYTLHYRYCRSPIGAQ